MAASSDKILKKAQIMRDDYERLLKSVTHPVIEVRELREQYMEAVPGYRTGLLIYTPDTDAEGLLPVYVVFHSGAFARGSAYLDDHVNRVTANRVGCIVAAVEFQLAPEVKFPVQIEECYRAVKWIYEHADEIGADKNRIAVGGHNSGGTIAAAVSHLIRDRHEFKVSCVLLDCAMFTLYSDLDELPDFDMDDPLKGPIRGVFFNTCYLGDLNIGFTDPKASPLLEKSLEGLPPTLVVIAGKDAARPDAEKYYQRLKDAGNDCTLKLYEGLPHGFNIQPGLADQATADAAFEYLDSYLSAHLKA